MTVPIRYSISEAKRPEYPYQYQSYNADHAAQHKGTRSGANTAIVLHRACTHLVTTPVLMAYLVRAFASESALLKRHAG